MYRGEDLLDSVSQTPNGKLRTTVSRVKGLRNSPEDQHVISLHTAEATTEVTTTESNYINVHNN